MIRCLRFFMLTIVGLTLPLAGHADVADKVDVIELGKPGEITIHDTDTDADG